MMVAKTGLAALVFVACWASAGSARAEGQPCAAAAPATTLDLSADGEAKLAPDMATLTLGVAAEAPSAAAAVSQDRSAMARTLGVLRAHGIAARDIQTAGLELTPQYVFAANQPRRLTGYQAANTVKITVRDLSQLGAVVDASVAAGANEVEGIGFGLQHPEAAQDEARRAAVAALQAKAALYAGATGYRIGRLVSLSEGAGERPGPVRLFAASPRVAGAPAPTPVEPGELAVRVSIQGVYALTR
jgi:hypothetical protein